MQKFAATEFHVVRQQHKNVAISVLISVPGRKVTPPLQVGAALVYVNLVQAGRQVQ